MLSKDGNIYQNVITQTHWREQNLHGHSSIRHFKLVYGYKILKMYYSTCNGTNLFVLISGGVYSLCCISLELTWRYLIMQSLLIGNDKYAYVISDLQICRKKNTTHHSSEL